MDTGSEKDLFFHSSSLDGVSYEEHSFSNREEQIWVTGEVKIKAKGNNRKSPCLAPRKNDN